jgi:uncharacterized membrane protein (UPF0127 family)
MKKLLVFLLALAGMLPASLQRRPTRFITIYIQDKPFQAEIADTPEKHAKGLMFRTRIKDDFAMLFVFTEEEIRSFWMKNTLIPLDIIYLNSDKQIVDMYVSVPPCKTDPCPGYESALPARFVVEINGGLAKKLKLKIGDKIFIPID